jgi:hypothetical protein
LAELISRMRTGTRLDITGSLAMRLALIYQLRRGN